MCHARQFPSKPASALFAFLTLLLPSLSIPAIAGSWGLEYYTCNGNFVPAETSPEPWPSELYAGEVVYSPDYVSYEQFNPPTEISLEAQNPSNDPRGPVSTSGTIQAVFEWTPSFDGDTPQAGTVTVQVYSYVWGSGPGSDVSDGFNDPVVFDYDMPTMGGTHNVKVQVAAGQTSFSLPAYSLLANNPDGTYSGASVTFAAQTPGSSLGQKRSKGPGHNPNGHSGPVCPICNTGKGTGGVSAQIDKETGNALVSVDDSESTQGASLVNNININSQTVETGRPMGNATFDYDMHVTTGAVYTQSGSSTTNYLMVDGDGTRLNFGPTSSSPAPVGAIFSTLTPVTGGGYTLTGAGPPEELDEAGNYSYQFNSNGQLTQITDPQSNVQTLTYSDGVLTQATDESTGNSINYSYTNGLITSISQGNGAEVTNLTYSSGNLTGVSINDGSGDTLKTVSLSYSGTTGLLSTVERDSDPSSVINFTYTYMPDTNTSDTTGVPMANYNTAYNESNIDWGDNLDGGASDTVEQSFQNNNPATAVQYNSNSSGQLTQVVTPAAAGATAPLVENYSYNGQNQVTGYTDGLLSESTTYATNGLMTSNTDTLGNEWLWNYSGANLTSSQDPVEQAAGDSETWTYGDSSQPNVPTGYTDAAGNAWSLALNAHGQTTEVTPPDGSPEGSTTYNYDETVGSATLGYLTSMTDGAGDLATYDSYDALGDLTSVSTYPVEGSTTTKDTTLYDYDAAQRVTQITEPDGATQQFTYDGRNLASSTDEAGTTYDYSYCASCGMLDGIAGPDDWSLAWAFGPDHQLESFTDANGNETTYTYGNANELDTLAYPDGSGFSYLYNNQQQVSQVTNGRGDAITLGYDADERLSGVAFPTTSQPSVSVGYDADSRVNTFTDGVGTTTYTYAVNGWLTKVVYNYSAYGLANAQELDYTYYPDGSRESMTWKNGSATVGTWTYTYDSAGRLSTVENPWSETTSYSYDGDGKLTGQDDSNGLDVAYTYVSGTDWPASIADSVGSTTLASYALTYDDGDNTAGNLTGVTEADSSTVSYGYDSLYRLTSEDRDGTDEESESYGYDLAGNPTSFGDTSYTYDDGNKITNSGYSYDADGDLLTDGTTTYTWDDRGDMTSRTVGGAATTYAYDARGLRVESSAGGGTFYIYDGSELLGEVSANGTVNVAYTWGADGLVSEHLVPSDQTLYYLFGPQGETRQLVNSNAEVVDTYLYDAYGNPVSSTGSDPNPFRFGGQFGYYTDSSDPSGALLCMFRWYDPVTGRWINRDPIGYSGGQNMFNYSGDDPINFADANGTRRYYIHNPGHYSAPVYDPYGDQDAPAYNNQNYVLDIPNSQSLTLNMNLGIFFRERADPGNLVEQYYYLKHYTANNTIGDYGKNCDDYPSDNNNPTLTWERRLGGNFNYGAMGAAMGVNLNVLLAGGQALSIWHNFQLHPQSEQDAIEDGYWYFYITHPGYQGIDGVTPPAGVVINQGPPDNDPN